MNRIGVKNIRLNEGEWHWRRYTSYNLRRAKLQSD
jgi:hypothetical protein